MILGAEPEGSHHNVTQQQPKEHQTETDWAKAGRTVLRNGPKIDKVYKKSVKNEQKYTQKYTQWCQNEPQILKYTSRTSKLLSPLRSVTHTDR